MNLDKKVFTTFEAAQLCYATATSIKNWIERGDLKAFRTPGGHHRIERENLIAFLRLHRMPNPFESERPRRALIGLVDEGLEFMLELAFLERNWEVRRTKNLTETLLTIGAWRPELIWANRQSGLPVAQISRWLIKARGPRPSIILLGAGKPRLRYVLGFRAPTSRERDEIESLVSHVLARVEENSA